MTDYDIQPCAIGECSRLLNGNGLEEFTNDQRDRWLRDHYNFLHNLCWNPSVTASNIQQCIQQHHDGQERGRTNDLPQFTPLHLLAANPSVTGQMITAYLQLAPDVAVMQDSIGSTPLYMLCSVPYFSDDSGGAISIIRAYLASEEGRRAAFMKDFEDDKRRTPFDRLCEKGFDELLFLNNRSFGGLIVWWYDCLDINLFAEYVN